MAHVSDVVHNNGVSLFSIDTGAGRGAFKALSLRNVAVRQHFMHDGNFSSPAEVVEFYNSGVQPNADLDPRLKTPTGAPRRLGLSTSQKGVLVAFLKTLTDSVFLTAPRFAISFTAPPLAPLPPLPPASLTADVIMQATAYHPPNLTVDGGTVVTWTNLDNRRHSATFTSSGVGSTSTFSSGSQRLTMPTVAGTYAYHCAVHGGARRGNERDDHDAVKANLGCVRVGATVHPRGNR